MEDYGEFEEVKEEGKHKAGQNVEPEVFGRARLPGRGEFIGVILQRLGGSRMEIKASDGKIRNCRVPGRYKRKLWLRPRDIVLIMPWSDNDNKGDVIFKYHGSAINHLRKKGLLDNLKQEF